MKTKKVNLIICAGLSVIALVIAILMINKINSLPHENIAKDFSQGTNFAQITLYIPESAEFNVDKVMYFRYNLEKKLTEKSIAPENEGARLYVDAFSCYKDITLKSEKRQSNAKAMLVGGDYQIFNKEFITLPNVINDVNRDRIIISKSAAWQLYGGYSLYDFPVYIGDKTYYISEVFDEGKEKEQKEFFGEKSTCLIDIESEKDARITCYEILLVNPIKGFAASLVKECLEIPEETYLMVENSSRFSVINILQGIPKLIKTDDQLPDGVKITYKEIMARNTGKQLSLMMLIFIIFALYPFIWVIILTFKLIKLIKRLMEKYVFSKIRDKLSYS